MNAGRRVGLAGAVVMVLVAVGSVTTIRREYSAPGPLPADRAVVVPRGSLAQVAQALAASGVIGRELAFRAAALATREQGALHAGELAFPAHASLAETLEVLRRGRPVLHRVTIPEGLTAAQIAVLLDRAAPLSGNPVVPGEGTVLPETYDVERGASRASIVSRAQSAMDRALAQAWAHRQSGLPYVTPRDLLVVASMVERETAKPQERAHIAGVFVNRLRQGMRLQSDPTVAYAVSGGETLERKLTRADLAWPNPYNTYASIGLPPGPIDSPGPASLLAAARPDATDDLYFVADGSGGHAFARTLAGHEQNVARWRAMQAAP